MPSTNASSPAAFTCSTYDAVSMSSSGASRRADATAFAAETADLSMPNRVTGRSVTSRWPPAPRMSARFGARPSARPRVPPVRSDGSTTDGSHATCHCSPDEPQRGLGGVGPVLLAHRPRPAEGGDRGAVLRVGLGDVLDRHRRLDLAEPLDHLGVGVAGALLGEADLREVPGGQPVGEPLGRVGRVGPGRLVDGRAAGERQRQQGGGEGGPRHGHIPPPARVGRMSPRAQPACRASQRSRSTPWDRASARARDEVGVEAADDLRLDRRVHVGVRPLLRGELVGLRRGRGDGRPA